MPKPNRLVFLFHRDLRLVDHGGLERAAQIAKELSAEVVPLFIFTPQQVTHNPYKSIPAIQFMCDSLAELEADVKRAGGTLRFAYGDTTTVLASIANLAGVLETRDYTPFAKEREAAISKFSKERGILYEAVDDVYLTVPGSVRTGTGRIYQKFTPFYDAVKGKAVPKPLPLARVPWYSGRLVLEGAVTIKDMQKRLVPHRNTNIQPGGRSAGLNRFTKIATDYEAAHDDLARESPQLSAHHHFGTVSIRESYWASNNAAYKRQLYWRDFYGHLMAAFKDLYGADPWEFQAPISYKRGEKEVLEAWKKGETGVALVDAGIRQMLQTGFMHNRARMVVASWLVKDQGVHWRWGERFFAKHLVDYDPAQNMMNWISVASVLPFGSPPFRRHDPEASAKRLDKAGTYRERWLHTSSKT
jgi:deoxyribodipyrimidine photo-lyase